MAKVTIGGTDYELGPLNFKAIKRIWPRVSATAKKAKDNPDMTPDDGLESVDVAIDVIVAAFERTHPEHTVEWIEENLLGHELAGIQISMHRVMVESGLLQEASDIPGEALAPKKGKTSTGTGIK